jgi:hypothetical protein
MGQFQLGSTSITTLPLLSLFPLSSLLPFPPSIPSPLPSQGWADPSPVLPSRYSGAPYTPAQMKVLAGELANLTARAGRAAARWMPEDYMLWLSTDHFGASHS